MMINSTVSIPSMKLLENWLSLMSTLEEVQKPLKVMGVFEEVSKVVPLWHSFKHGPHERTLEEKESEGNYKWIQNLIGLIVLVNLFPTIGGTPRGSSRLRSYSLLKMKP
jgi:hypothetical protein